MNTKKKFRAVKRLIARIMNVRAHDVKIRRQGESDYTAIIDGSVYAERRGTSRYFAGVTWNAEDLTSAAQAAKVLASDWGPQTVLNLDHLNEGWFGSLWVEEAINS